MCSARLRQRFTLTNLQIRYKQAKVATSVRK
jgi:hypothetical protein